MNWDKEYDGLKNSGEWFKPKAGQSKIKIMSDGEEYETEYEGEKRKKVKFEIEVNNHPYVWGINKSTTETSLYGQMVVLGRSKGNLKGQTITLIVMGEGKETRYTILEAIPLMTPKEEKI